MYNAVHYRTFILDTHTTHTPHIHFEQYFSENRVNWVYLSAHHLIWCQIITQKREVKEHRQGNFIVKKTTAIVSCNDTANIMNE